MKLLEIGRRAAAVTRTVVADIVRLRLPVTATAIVATVTGIVGPFGVDLGSRATMLAGILVAIGTACETVKRMLDAGGAPSTEQ